MARTNIFINANYQLGTLPNKQGIRLINIEPLRERQSLGIYFKVSISY